MQFDLIEQICLTELTRRDRHRYGTGRLYRDIIETLSLPAEQRGGLQRDMESRVVAHGAGRSEEGV